MLSAGTVGYNAARSVKNEHAAADDPEPHASKRLTQEIESLLDMVGSRL